MQFIVNIEESTGKILNVQFPTSAPNPEGLSEDGYMRTVHVNEDELLEGCENANFFVNEHWYNHDTQEFFKIGLPPNDYAEYNRSTGSFEWDTDLILEDIRRVRTNKLAACDWTQVSDNTLTEEQRAEARTYRTTLRNITQGLTLPDHVDDMVWPTPPSFLP